MSTVPEVVVEAKVPSYRFRRGFSVISTSLQEKARLRKRLSGACDDGPMTAGDGGMNVEGPNRELTVRG
jgi:hypothetical protein